MKRKLLLAAVALMCSVGMQKVHAAAADYLTDWTEVTSLPSKAELSAYYYVFVATEADLMLAQEKNVEQESELTVVYRYPMNPYTWKRVVWTLEYDDTYLYGIRNLNNSTHLMQSRGNWPWRVQFAWETAQSQWTQWQFAYDAEKKWTIQNKLSAGNGGGDTYYVGPWNEKAWANGEVTAGNKEGDNIGHFKIYQILRTEYNENAKAYPTDVTNLITNPSFDNGDAFAQKKANAVSTAIPGWTVSEGGNYQYYTVGKSRSNTPDNDSGYGKELTAANGTQYVHIRHGWKNSTTSITQTLSSMPEGEYVLTLDHKGATPQDKSPKLTVKATPATGSVGGVKYSSYPLSKSRANPATYSFDSNYGDWSTISYEFFVTATGNVELYIGCQDGDKTNSSNDEVIFDNLCLTYKNYTATLQSALDRANLLYTRTSDSDLKDAIDHAQGVLDAANNTTAYQSTINSEVTTLRSAISTAYASVEFASGENITFLLENASFESSDALPANVTTAISDITTAINYASMQPVEGWTINSTESNIASGVFAYGGTVGINGYAPSDVSAPVVGHENAVGMIAGWGAKVQYKQNVTLPAGRYSVTVPVYNKGGATAFTKNLIGFIENGGTEHLATTTAYTVGSWTTTKIDFDLNAETAGYMSVGYTSKSGEGSGNMPRLYIDGFTITFTDAANAYAATVASATTTYNDAAYINVIGTEKSALKDLIDADASSYTVEEYFTAIDNINAAVATFTAAKTNYDALVTEIAKAKTLGIATATADSYAATASSTAATALTSTQNLKVAEYNFVNTNYAYSVDLGAWTKTGPTGSKDDQHWSDTSHEYLEQSSAAWGQSAWTISYNQDLTLPAGNYVFKVSGRKAASDGVTLGLTVTNKTTSAVLGSVNDFPEGDTGLGINKDGDTSFDSEDAAGFANSGNGRGWEWRYVKFTLAADATVNVSVDAEATTSHMWVSFCDATVQTDDDANISLIAYNIALNSAQTIIANDEYENVTGSEKTALQAAIDADASLDKSDKEKIDAAKDLLETRTTAFTGAKSNYDTYVAAKAVIYPTLAYAAASKRTTLDGAQAAADATSASDADTKTAAIQTAARQYYESHALAEGVVGAENKTNLISDPNFSGVTVDGTSAGAWTFDQTGGDAKVTSSESFTDGSGSSSYSYFDYYNGSNNNQNIHQVISDLAPGRYLLTATGRGHSNFNNNLQLYVVGKGDVKIPAVGSSGGVFNRGWNDASLEFNQYETGNITIGAKTNNNQAQWWGVTRFRLVRLGDPVTSVTISEAGWATLYFPYALDFSEVAGLTAYTASVAGSTVTLNAVDDVPANTGVVLNGTEGSYNIPVIASSETAQGDLIGNASAATAWNYFDDYTLYALAQAEDYPTHQVQFRPVTSGSVAAGKAFLKISNSTPVKAFTVEFADADGIKAIDNGQLTIDNAEIYNLAGQRMSKLQKGVNIVNGKKVLVK